MSIPGVLEKPGFEAWPPEMTANFVFVEAMIFIYVIHLGLMFVRRTEQNPYDYRCIICRANFYHAC